MPIQATEKIWHNGKWIKWDDAKLHVLSHVVGYGSAVFEGIRCYETKQGPAIWRLREHMQRLINSARIYRMELPYSLDDFCNVATELVRENNLKSCYVKPIVLRGYGEVGVNPLNSPIEIYMACWSWGAYLGPEALAKGVDIGVSSWTRIAPNTLPAMSKAAANYMNSQLIRMEAQFNNYAEGIALDTHGHVSEGSGMNVFLVHEGTLFTPPLATSILPGITRDAIVKIAEDLNIPVKEAVIPREMLYIVDELFFVGTAVEVTPIRSVDHIQIGKGVAGPITRRIQEEFFALTSGSKPDRHNWLTPVNAPVAAAR
ncbi:MAG TPA: branched-chain amino acid transaminase [Candidatus Saccharimonadales bacterium]|nr:branched-chain amino acid transaminase [Candidatus Saccharimonadales bacterium]